MAVTIVSFRWLEILEKEFDKNFVDLDLLIGDLDADEPDFVHSARQKLAELSSCFAQLTHKAQTIFQNSAKVEAELVDLRTEVVNSKTRQEILEEESRNLVLQLHSLQLDRLPSNQNPEQYKEKIETALKLSPSKSVYSDEIIFRNNSEVKKLKNELLQYQGENIILRNSILALHSEVYGARLAAKYLDKELAGRIQQLQLLGKEMRTDVRDKLWRQLESEILLHRHKTVIRACRNRTSHEFINTDSKVLNFNNVEDKFVKNQIVRPGDSVLLFDDTVNSHKENDLIKKSEPHLRHQYLEALNHNHNGISAKNFNNNNVNHVSNHVIEWKNSQNNGNKYKMDLNPDANIKRTNDSTVDNCNKVKNIDLHIDKNVESKLSEDENDIKNEYKTEEEKLGRKDIKKVVENGKKRKCLLSEVEDSYCIVGEKRVVIVKRQSGQGLGISITGGREHGVPILISELEVGGPAYDCKNLFVGDAILKVNDISLENTSHFEAVKILTNLDTNNVKLLVQFIAVDTDEENSLSEDLYGYRYRFFDTEVMDSSDALGLHPLHSNSAHTPTAPRTPDLNRSEKPTGNTFSSSTTHSNSYTSHDSRPQVENNRTVEGPVERSQNLIDIDTEIVDEKSEKLKIDIFGLRFQTSIQDIPDCGNDNLLDDFIVKKADEVKTDADLIQIEVTGSKSPTTDKKFEYVDENIFSGLEDHSILDNIMKSFSEDDFSYLDAEKEKNLASDSGLEVCLSGSDIDGEKVCMDEHLDEENHINDWVENEPEKVELKTLQQIFDRSFSSNLSSPRGSTSFDDDILSTEQSDEKSNCIRKFKSKEKDLRNIYNPKKVQKCVSKSMSLMEEMFKKSGNKIEGITSPKDEILNKKLKKSSSEVLKRNKCVRKSKENLRKDLKTDKKKIIKEPESDLMKTNEIYKRREMNLKMADQFQDNLIEYTTKGCDVNSLSPIEDHSQGLEGSGDELEETRRLSRKYGLKIPGKSVKTECCKTNEGKSPEHCVKILESHFKQFKPILENTAKVNEKESKTKSFRFTRYESFGDPDFGTPV